MNLRKVVLSLSLLTAVIVTFSGCTAPADPGAANAPVYVNQADGTPVSQ